MAAHRIALATSAAPRRRWQLVAAAAAVVVVVAGVTAYVDHAPGSERPPVAVTPTPPGPKQPPVVSVPTPAVAGANRALAVAEAARVLAAIPVPPGATRSVTAPAVRLTLLTRITSDFNDLDGAMANTEQACGSPVGIVYVYAVTFHWPGHTLAVDPGAALCGIGTGLTLDGTELTQKLEEDTLIYKAPYLRHVSGLVELAEPLDQMLQVPHCRRLESLTLRWGSRADFSTFVYASAARDRVVNPEWGRPLVGIIRAGVEPHNINLNALEDRVVDADDEVVVAAA